MSGLGCWGTSPCVPGRGGRGRAEGIGGGEVLLPKSLDQVGPVLGVDAPQRALSVGLKTGEQNKHRRSGPPQPLGEKANSIASSHFYTEVFLSIDLCQIVIVFLCVNSLL